MSDDLHATVDAPRKRNTNPFRDRVRRYILFGGAIAFLIMGIMDRVLIGIIAAVVAVVAVQIVPGRPYPVYKVPGKLVQGFLLRKPRRTFSRLGSPLAGRSEQAAYQQARGAAWVIPIPVAEKPGSGSWLAEFTNGRKTTVLLEIVAFRELASGTAADKVAAMSRLIRVIKQFIRKMALGGDRVALFSIHGLEDYTQAIDWKNAEEFDPETVIEAELIEDNREASVITHVDAFDTIQGVAITTDRPKSWGKKVDEGTLSYHELRDNRAIQLLEELERRLSANRIDVRIPSFFDAVTWVRVLFQAMSARATYKLRKSDYERVKDFGSITESKLVQAGLTPDEGAVHRHYAQLGDTYVATFYTARFPSAEMLVDALAYVYGAPIETPHGISVIFNVEEAAREGFFIQLKRRVLDALGAGPGSASAKSDKRYEAMEAEDWAHEEGGARVIEFELRAFVAAGSTDVLEEQMTVFEEAFDDADVLVKRAVGKGVHVPALWRFLGIDANKV